MTETKEPKVCESELEALGFTAAATGLKQKRELARKMRIAFEHYRVVTPEYIQRFNNDLYDRSKKSSGNLGGYTYQSLKFTPIAQYPEIPPVAALEALRDAKSKGCFDNFEVATIQSVTVVPDPILFGTITGCDNKYFIAQWDEDVKIEDILRPDEG